jgi:plastocyanin
MEERKTHARGDPGGRASAAARWWLSSGVAAVVLAAAVSPTSAAGSGSPGAEAPADFPVAVTNNVFSPTNAPINQGDTVTWTNQGILHNVVFDDGSFTYPMSPSSSNWSISRQFNSPGVFRYYCVQHGGPGGIGMSGTVTVSAVAPPPGGPPPPVEPPPPPGGDPPGGPPPGGDPTPGAPPGGKLSTRLSLRVSDATPARGGRVRFFGSVQPEQDGRLLQLQRRGRGGSYRTLKRLKLRDAGTSRSRFSGTLRVLGDAVFRARLPADSRHQTGTSRTRRLNVP